MRDGTRLGFMATSLVGMFFLVSACGSGDGESTETTEKPDGAVSAGGAGATGAFTSGSGGTTGLPGSSSSQGGSQSGSRREPDAGIALDATARPDVAQARDTDLDWDSGISSDAEILYGLSPGPYCFEITSIAPGYRDDCQIGVEALPGNSLQGNYDPSTGVFSLGAEGSLGSGTVRYNQGTLQRSQGPFRDPDISGCTWKQAVTTLLTMTDTNKFTVSVTEAQDAITPACGTTFTSCTSTWTWTMELDPDKSAPGCY